jgi:hypothetical protein
MIKARNIPNSLRLAALALVLAAIYLAWSAANAFSTPVVKAQASRPPANVIALHENTGPRPEIQAAVDKDPFSPTRTRPPTRYRLAGEVDAVPTGPSQRQPVRWVGIILYPDNPSQSKLAVSLGSNQNAPAQMLKVGEKIGDYTLKSFDYKTATFQHIGGDMIVIANPRKGIK